MKIRLAIPKRVYGRSLNNFVSSIPLFSFTNFVPLSVVGAPFSIFSLFSIRTISILLNFFPFVLLVIFSIVSVLMYDPNSFLDFLFYRRDGNFFITVAILLVGLTFARHENAEHTLKILVYFAVISFVLLWPIEAVILGNKNVHALFIAHNAAGGFFSVMAVLSLFLFEKKRRVVIALTLCFAVFETGSRGSLLGMLIVYAMFFVRSRFWLRWMIFSFFLVLTVWIAIWSKGFYGDAATAYYRSEYSAGALELHKANSEQTGMVVGNSHNVFIRMAIVWPRAIEIISHYPILGAGFGAYDDRLFMESNGIFADKTEVIHSNSHAHHTFLHVAAEQGMVGVILLLASLMMFDWRFSACRDPITQAASYCLMLVMLMSLTEHRLYSPSNSVPMMFVISFALLRLDAYGFLKKYRFNV